MNGFKGYVVADNFDNEIYVVSTGQTPLTMSGFNWADTWCVGVKLLLFGLHWELLEQAYPMVVVVKRFYSLFCMSGGDSVLYRCLYVPML